MEAKKEEKTFLDELERWYARGDRDVSAVGPVDLDRVRTGTPLRLAARWGWCSAIDWLVEKGADVNKGDPIHMETPLHAAVARKRLAAARRLLDAGADVNAPDEHRKTPLYINSEYGNLPMCKLLLSRGADHEIRDDQGNSPEDCAKDIIRRWLDHIECHSGFVAHIDSSAMQNAKQVRALLVAVREAGGWQAYLDAPRRELLAFRRQLLGLRRRANAPAVLERLFFKVPEDVFTHTLAFWRTDRDA
jgi:hypothetical protein